MNFFTRTSMFLCVLAIHQSCKKTHEPASPLILANTTVNAAGLYPESIDYDNNHNAFVAGSYYKGNISEIGLGGTIKTIIDDKNLTTVAGVYTDEAHNRLIVVSGDAGVSTKSLPGGTSAGTKAYVGVYNLQTHILIRGIDLRSLNSGSTFPNDVTVDDAGNIYVTDSYSPQIYRIDGQDYTATVFLSNSQFQAAPQTFGLNGIVFSPAGFLLVDRTDNGKLFKIPVANPTAFKEVAGVTIIAADGLEFTKTGDLVVVENGRGNGVAHTLRSTDSWNTAMELSHFDIGKDEFPTSATLAADGNIYVVSSHLSKILNRDTTQVTFNIQRIN